MKPTRHFILALSFTLLAACGPSEKEKLINGMTALVEQVDQRYADMTDEEWVSADQRFEGYVNKNDELKSEMTDIEKQLFNELTGRYVAIRTKRFGLDTKEWIDNFSEQLDGFLLELENTSVKDLKEFFE